MRSMVEGAAARASRAFGPPGDQPRTLRPYGSPLHHLRWSPSPALRAWEDTHPIALGRRSHGSKQAGAEPFCAPAALVYENASDRPLARQAIGFYDFG